MFPVKSLRARGIASIACLVVALFLIVIGAVFAYLDRHIFDSQQFAAHAVETLDNEAVQEYIAREVTDSLVEQNPDLATVEVVVQDIVASAVGLDAFKPLLFVSAVEVHETLFTADGGSIFIDLANAGTIVVSVAQAANPEIADDVEEFQTTLVYISDRGFATDLIELAESVSFLAWLFPLLAILFLLGGLGFAVDRRRAIFRIGVTLALGALLVWIGSRLLRGALLDGVDDTVQHAALAGVLDTFLDALIWWLVVVGAAGLLLAASASAMLTPEGMRARAASLWAALTTPRASRVGVTAQAIALVLLGAAAIARPLLLAEVVIIALGAFAILVALTNALGLFGPKVDWRAHDEAEDAPAPRRRWATPAVVGGLVVVGLVVALSLSNTKSGNEPAAFSGCNGHRELCDRSLSEVALPATHNAMAASGAGFITPNQRDTMVEQLNAGMRALLIDMLPGEPVGDSVRNVSDPEEMAEVFGEDFVVASASLAQSLGGAATGPPDTYLCHVLCELGFIRAVDGLRDVREWLELNPNEVLVLIVQDVVPPEEIEQVFVDSGLMDFVYTHNADTTELPTLRDLIESGQRVVVMTEEQGLGPDTWLPVGFETVLEETPFAFDTVDDVLGAESCRPERGGTGQPLFQLNHWTPSYPPSPSAAQEINIFDALLERAERCREERGHMPNIVAVDFAELGDVVAVADRLNGVD